MKKMWKKMLWLFAVACICSQMSFQAMATEELSTGTIDASEMVFQAGGLGEEGIGSPMTTFVVTARDQLKTQIYQTLKNGMDSLDVGEYNLVVDDLTEVQIVFSEVLNEHAELFYVKSSFSYSYYPNSGEITSLKFLYHNFTSEQKQAFSDALTKAFAGVDESMTDVEKALVLHDYLAQNCAYAYSEYLAGTLSQIPNVYNAYGVLVDRRAVCQGYSLAYSALLHMAGIESYLCTSDSMNHAWNVILIDGEWYHVDVTWDDPVWNKEGQVKHSYFLLSDAEMLNREHNGWVDSVECTSTLYDSSSYWWNEIDSLIYLGNKDYYIEVLSSGFQITEKSGASTTARYTSNAIWESWGGGGYWPGAFSYLSKQGNYLYFNDKLNLYAMNINSGTPQVIYTYNGGEGYIYGAMVYDDGTARLNISQSPNMENDNFITVDLSAEAPKLTVNYETETISTTTAMVYSINGGSTWQACTANMKLQNFGWNGTKNISVLFKVAENNGLSESSVTEIVLTALPGTTGGQINCAGNMAGDLTIQLFDSNGAVIATSVIGSNENEYGLPSVNSGSYKMMISKKNYVSREYTITVGAQSLIQDIEIHLIGDISGDGTVNAKDKKMIYNHMKGSSTLVGYDLAVGDVTGDSVINAKDKKKIFNHMAGSSSLWE